MINPQTRELHVTIYHNPRCSKSRQTLELLKNKGYNPQVIEYLNTPPTVVELKDILKKLKRTAKEIVRTGEDIYRELKLNHRVLTEEEMVQLLVQNPILIERPIVVRGNHAAIGRPPENVLQALDL